jgi:hypothetical protein
MLILSEPAPGIALIGASDCGGSTLVSVSLYLYGEGVEQVIAQQQSAWQAWMDQAFEQKPANDAKE